MVSIICPIYNEEKYIKECIESILNQNFPKERIEVLLIDGMSSDRTREIINKYCEEYSFIHLLDNPERAVSPALNIGINNSRGEFIIRLDAHAVYPKNYISTLIENAEKLNCENIGGVVNTLPADKSSKALAISKALSHSFGMGNSHFRIGAKEIKKVDTVPFGCFKRDVFNEIGLFDVDLTRNQDDEFNGRIIKNGGEIYLLPDLVIKYYARDTISKVSKMFYQYGLFKPLVNKKLGSPATARQFFPLLFVLGLILGPILGLVSKSFFAIYIAVLLLYLLIATVISTIEVVKQKNMKLLFFLPITFLVIHFSYGWGYLIGIIRFIIIGKNNKKIKVSR